MARYKYPNSKIFVITRSREHRDLAEQLGAYWTGGIDDVPPERIDVAIDFTPAGETVREALRNLEWGGRLVINAVRKATPVPELDYGLIWHEKEVKSVANVTRKDAEDFLPLAAKIPIMPKTQLFDLEGANEALILLKKGLIQGAGILRIPR